MRVQTTVGASALNNPVTVAQGGTGDTTLTSNGVLYGQGTGNVAITAQGAAGTVLHGNGGAPTFTAVAAADLATTAINQGVVNLTTSASSSSTTTAAVTGMSITATSVGRYWAVSFQGTALISGTASDGAKVELWDGTVGSGTRLATNEFIVAAVNGANTEAPCSINWMPATAITNTTQKTYNIGFKALTGGTAQIIASATDIGTFMVNSF